MSFLNALINELRDEELAERLEERIAIIQHKIKFMDKVTVVILDTYNGSNAVLEGLLNDAGGVLQEDPLTARVVIYCEKDMSMLQLMGMVPALLATEWPAVEYNRVYLWDDPAAVLADPATAVEALEDLAEMLYPGYFVFGNEGKTWISFKTQ